MQFRETRRRKSLKTLTDDYSYKTLTLSRSIGRWLTEYCESHAVKGGFQHGGTQSVKTIKLTIFSDFFLKLTISITSKITLIHLNPPTIFGTDFFFLPVVLLVLHTLEDLTEMHSPVTTTTINAAWIIHQRPSKNPPTLTREGKHHHLQTPATCKQQKLRSVHSLPINKK